MAVTKEILVQYSDLQEEIKKIRLQIQQTEDDIEKLLNEGTVVDKVNGGLGGIQGFKIEGFPIREFERRKKILRKRKDRLTEFENNLLEQTEIIEEFIEQIKNSRDRQIFRGFFLENKTQQQIARELYIDRSLVSKIINKYL